MQWEEIKPAIWCSASMPQLFLLNKDFCISELRSQLCAKITITQKKKQIQDGRFSSTKDFCLSHHCTVARKQLPQCILNSQVNPEIVYAQYEKS